MSLLSDIPDSARKLFDKVDPVGSRVTCNPAPTDTDADFLVFTTTFNELVDELFGAGFVLDGDARYLGMDRGAFNSFRRGTVNLIVTDDDDFHARFLAASSVAKHLNLLNKSDRIALFQAVLYGRRHMPDIENVPVAA